MTDTSIRGRFVWHELMTTDTRAAAGFFNKVVGWKTQAWDQQPSYSMFVTGKSPMGGLMPLPEEAKAGGTAPTWVTYIGTPDVDETAMRAATLGGRVLRQPADIPTIGRFAILADPQGAMFAAFTPLQAPQPDAPAGVGDFSWHELMTTDWQGALKFYQQLFGWDTMDAFNDPAIGTYQMYGRNGRMLGGMFNAPVPPAPVWLAYIRVPDAKKVADTIKKLGGTVVNGPMEVPGGDWITQAVDPQGVMFAVHSRKPAARRAAAPARKAARKATPKKKAVVKKKSAGRAAVKRTAAKKKSAPKKKAAPKRKVAAKRKSSSRKTSARTRRASSKKR